MITALYMAVTLYITVTEQLPDNRALYLLLSWPVYSGHLYITDTVTLQISRIHNFIIFYPI